jgi:hypothetical protein
MSGPPRATAELLAPFVDALPLPSRLISAERDGRLTVRMRAGTHRFHRDLTASSIWGFERTVPGPTIEAIDHAKVASDERDSLGRVWGSSIARTSTLLRCGTGAIGVCADSAAGNP